MLERVLLERNLVRMSIHTTAQPRGTDRMSERPTAASYISLRVPPRVFLRTMLEHVLLERNLVHMSIHTTAQPRGADRMSDLLQRPTEYGLLHHLIRHTHGRVPLYSGNTPVI